MAQGAGSQQRRGVAVMCEGFALETADGLIFTVKGLVHPPDRVIAYLRYLPDPQGDRERGGVRHRRVYRFDEQREILQARYPDFLERDPVFGMCLQSVPRSLIRVVYDPCRRLADLREHPPASIALQTPPQRAQLDAVEADVDRASADIDLASVDVDRASGDALGLTQLLQEASGVPWDSLGVSGSVLVGTQREDSDVDLVVYGDAAGRAVHLALRHLLDDPTTPLRRPDWEELAALHAAHRPDTPLSFDDFVRLQSRKVNEVRFRGRECFIRFVKRPAEVGERYGDRRFEALGAATVRARVTDDRDAIFTPCKYGLADVEVADGHPLDGPTVADVREMASFRGRFSDQARVGERVVARGRLERVVPQTGVAYHRLVVGGRAGDYLLSQDV